MASFTAGRKFHACSKYPSTIIHSFWRRFWWILSAPWLIFSSAECFFSPSRLARIELSDAANDRAAFRPEDPRRLFGSCMIVYAYFKTLTFQPSIIALVWIRDASLARARFSASREKNPPLLFNLLGSFIAVPYTAPFIRRPHEIYTAINRVPTISENQTNLKISGNCQENRS